MTWKSTLLIAAAFAAGSTIADAEDRVFVGPWKTTNRKLDGEMTAVLRPLAKDQWQGRFFGVWQGVPFDYTVKFTGPESSLRGTAVIDHADYTWTGSISDDSPAVFKGRFGGSRYTGNFALKEKQAERAATVTAAEVLNKTR
jgi:hypothetical protein